MTYTISPRQFYLADGVLSPQSWVVRDWEETEQENLGERYLTKSYDIFLRRVDACISKGGGLTKEEEEELMLMLDHLLEQKRIIASMPKNRRAAGKKDRARESLRDRLDQLSEELEVLRRALEIVSEE